MNPLYEQGSLDGLGVYVKSDGTLQFVAHRHPDTASADVTRDEVLQLYAALGEWLYPVHTPEAPNRSLIEQLIDKAAKDAVTAILPLHLHPASADRWGYVDASPNPYATQSSPGLCRDCGDTRPSLALYHACTADVPLYCTVGGCTFPSTPGATHYEHDPEPRDVGHPDVPEVTTAGRWEAELRRDAGKSVPLPYCAACGHSNMRHNLGECSISACKCDRNTP